jgi:hypothetical protein
MATPLINCGSYHYDITLIDWDQRNLGSYCLYLAHLPLVILLQSLIRSWDLPAAVKFWGLMIFASAVLLVSYQLLVRYTPIGTMLNGKRVRAVREKCEMPGVGKPA